MTAAPKIAPYGTWASPISAARLAAGAISVSDLQVEGDAIYWLESRPEEGGRTVLMRRDGAGAIRQLTPEGFYVRTRVHEYGGAPYRVVGETIWFANFADQRLYRQEGEAAPVAITAAGYRYADLSPVPRGGLLAVREDHTDPAHVANTVVLLSGQAGDADEVLFGDSDFVAGPTLSPDGARLAWIAWDHPNMPWDDTTLWLADFDRASLTGREAVAGGPGESVIEPRWRDDGALVFASDRTGFWNLYLRQDGATTAILERPSEFAGPLWQLGAASYALMEGRVLARESAAEGQRLVVIGPEGVRTLETPFSEVRQIRPLDAWRAAVIGASGRETAAVAIVDIETGACEVVRRPSPADLEDGLISLAEAIEFPTERGRTAHGLYYAPTNAAFAAPPGEKPPLIVQVHGGPTGQASGAFSLSNQYWTSRGFAVVDVDYGGSSGYGRAYRKRLEGQWGVVDIEDAAAAVRFLVAAGLADGERVHVHGGSAGGFTVLAALSQSPVFKAGASFYGVADLAALARDTHKFESRYLDGLIGPWPEAKALYDARSPLSHLDGFNAPLIIFQGSDDPIVPPNQAHMILDALRSRQRPVAYLEFAGESHGFRRADSLIAAKEAELYFLGQIFHFTPADPLPVTRIENLTQG